MKQYESKIWPGGLLNRINRMTMRAESHNIDCNSNFTGQSGTLSPGNPQSGLYSARSVIHRSLSEPPTERSLQDGTKNADV